MIKQVFCITLCVIASSSSIFASKPPAKRQCIRQGFDHKESLKLIEAAKNGNVQLVTNLLLRPNINVNIQGKREFTPLIWASRKGHLEVVKLLLATHKVDIDGLMGAWGETPLNMAAYSSSPDIVKLLLDHGAQINLANCFNKTALHYAIRAYIESEKKELATVKILLENGASSEIKNKEGITALQLAISKNCQEAAQLIQEAPQLIKNHKARKEMLPLLCGFHKRVGAKSIIMQLPRDFSLVYTIYDMLRFAK